MNASVRWRCAESHAWGAVNRPFMWDVARSLIMGASTRSIVRASFLCALIVMNTAAQSGSPNGPQPQSTSVDLGELYDPHPVHFVKKFAGEEYRIWTSPFRRSSYQSHALTNRKTLINRFNSGSPVSISAAHGSFASGASCGRMFSRARAAGLAPIRFPQEIASRENRATIRPSVTLRRGIARPVDAEHVKRYRLAVDLLQRHASIMETRYNPAPSRFGCWWKPKACRTCLLLGSLRAYRCTLPSLLGRNVYCALALLIPSN